MRHGRPGLLAIAALGMVLAGCGVPSAIDLPTYLETVGLNDVNLAALPDGTYTGAYTLALPPGHIAMYRHVGVQVTICGGRYAGITIVEPQALAAKSGFLSLVDRIEAANSLHVDAVSGATYSSRAMLKAVEAAVTR
jgi:uncharacterized protein with FMN-binding domain